MKCFLYFKDGSFLKIEVENPPKPSMMFHKFSKDGKSMGAIRLIFSEIENEAAIYYEQDYNLVKKYVLGDFNC